MTLAATGHATVVALAADLVRGRPSEHRFHHFHVVTRTSPVAALAEAARNADSVLLVPSELAGGCLDEVLELATGAMSVPVLLALTPGWTQEAASIAVNRGVRGLLLAPSAPVELGDAAHRALAGSRGRASEVLRVGALTLDVGQHLLAWQDEPIDARPQHLSTLRRLMLAHPGPVPLSDLRSRPGLRDAGVTTVRSTISQLRRMLHTATASRISIDVTPRVGYRVRVNG
ncbi:hypothetical protein [Agrococcus sp. ARC_14]|uniref:hypothetical protein n=1 Tax=Agrococcus sp. ARC_14 TaxID=2919927 RepID=UPI001F05296E|nr:hypothetical protein [Agrococcus sp. ARC_14]MCH1883236.1 hypothetical protein [Agrococcus sp. ARC_14]